MGTIWTDYAFLVFLLHYVLFWTSIKCKCHFIVFTSCLEFKIEILNHSLPICSTCSKIEGKNDLNMLNRNNLFSLKSSLKCKCLLFALKIQTEEHLLKSGL